VVFDLGAQAERLRALGYGRILPFPAEARAINDALVEAARDPQAGSGGAVGTHYACILEDYYQLASVAVPEARRETGLA
jgi:hypothetical protein